jgi:hypothetical protein
VDPKISISFFKRTATLFDENGEVVAVRVFGSGEEDEALFKRAQELRHNFPGQLALLWPERLDSNGHGHT